MTLPSLFCTCGRLKGNKTSCFISLNPSIMSFAILYSVYSQSTICLKLLADNICRPQCTRWAGAGGGRTMGRIICMEKSWLVEEKEILAGHSQGLDPGGFERGRGSGCPSPGWVLVGSGSPICSGQVGQEPQDQPWEPQQ